MERRRLDEVSPRDPAPWSARRAVHENEESMRVLFRDRRDAGRRLSVELMPLADQRPLVAALPRGGVPVAVEVARALGAPLDILAVRKLGAPHNPELAVGAVAEDGTGVLDRRSARMLGMTQAALDAALARESRELRRRVDRYRDGPDRCGRGSRSAKARRLEHHRGGPRGIPGVRFVARRGG